MEQWRVTFTAPPGEDFARGLHASGLELLTGEGTLHHVMGGDLARPDRHAVVVEAENADEAISQVRGWLEAYVAVDDFSARAV
jgi:hypothetical protein